MERRPVITLTEPGPEGTYEAADQRADGLMVLKPARERLSDVIRETEGKVLRYEGSVSHLERVSATVDDLMCVNERQQM